MGNVAGALGRIVVKKVRRFNIENRTERFLDKKVKVVAPRPKATQLEIEKLNREMPDLMTHINERNAPLLDRLKDVYVSASDRPLDSPPMQENPNRPLPVGRTTTRDPYGYEEPNVVSPGQLTLRQAIILISLYQKDRITNSIQSLAVEYNMSEEDVGNIVENFKVFTLVTPEEGSTNIGITNSDMLEPNIPTNFNVVNYGEKMQEMDDGLKSRSDKEKQKLKEKKEQDKKGENVNTSKK